MNNRSQPPDEAQILLVEDNPGDVRLLEEAFHDGQINNQLHTVTDGQAALDFIHRRDEYEDAPRPDAVLLDLNLPRVDGEDVLHEIKHHPELEDVLHEIKHHPELEDVPSLFCLVWTETSLNHATLTMMQTRMQLSKNQLTPTSFLA